VKVTDIFGQRIQLVI